MTVHPSVIAREQDGECIVAERSDICWLMIDIGYPAFGLAESPLQDHPTPLTADTKVP